MKIKLSIIIHRWAKMLTTLWKPENLYLKVWTFTQLYVLEFHHTITALSTYRERFSSLHANTLRQLSSRESTHVDTHQKIWDGNLRPGTSWFRGLRPSKFPQRPRAKAVRANENLRRCSAQIQRTDSQIYGHRKASPAPYYTASDERERERTHFFYFSPAANKRALKINKTPTISLQRGPWIAPDEFPARKRFSAKSTRLCANYCVGIGTHWARAEQTHRARWHF